MDTYFIIKFLFKEIRVDGFWWWTVYPSFEIKSPCSLTLNQDLS